MKGNTRKPGLVFPVYAGVILPLKDRAGLLDRVPRVCGGDPVILPA